MVFTLSGRDVDSPQTWAMVTSFPTAGGELWQFDNSTGGSGVAINATVRLLVFAFLCTHLAALLPRATGLRNRLPVLPARIGKLPAHFHFFIPGLVPCERDGLGQAAGVPRAGGHARRPHA